MKTRITNLALLFLLLASNSIVSVYCQEESDANPSVLLSTHGKIDKALIAQNANSTPTINDVPISDRAKSLAISLGLTELVVDLYIAKSEEFAPTTKLERRLEIFSNRQKISDRLRYSILQIQDTIAAIDLDLARSLRLYDYLARKKSKYDQRANIVTFIASGAFTILNGAFGYISNTNPSALAGVSAGASSSFLPFLTFRKHRYSNPDASTEDVNMLAQIFDKPTDERTEYSEIVWKFLNSPDRKGNSKLTRRQRIIREWASLREFKDISSKDLDILTGIAGKGQKVSLELLDARVDLLSDLRAEVSDVYRDLAHLQKELINL